MSLNNPERWLLRAEEYRAIAASMHNSSSSSMMERLASTYEQMAAAAGAKTRPLTAELCRTRAAECVAFSRRVPNDTTDVVLGVAQHWLDAASEYPPSELLPSAELSGRF
jgi:hypothetical protein